VLVAGEWCVNVDRAHDRVIYHLLAGVISPSKKILLKS
jgi:hypothetical protein